MKKLSIFYILLIISAVTIAGCQDDDTEVPSITITTELSSLSVSPPSTPEDKNTFSINYSISDNNSIKTHYIDLVDGNNDLIKRYDGEARTGSFTQEVNVPFEPVAPLIIKIIAEDDSGNIGSASAVLPIQGIDMVMNLNYGGEKLEYFEPVLYPTGDSMIITRVSYYLSDLRLDNNLVKSIDFINLEKAASDTSSIDGYIYPINVADGSYNNISFNIGISAELNAMKPADFSSGHPLAKPEEYWNSWESYVFAKIEGRIDLDDDPDFERPISLHLGSDNALMSYSFDKNINVITPRSTITFDFDLRNVFENDGDIYDIAETPATHTLEKMPQIVILKNNMEKAITIK